MKLPLACAILLTASAAQAAPQMERIRGTIAAADATSVTVHTQDGNDVTVALDPAAHFATVMRSDIASVAPGSFIGTATKGSGSHMTALEVVVFPPEMRGQGEGHYAWDKLPDTSSGAPGGAIASTMTNGTVEAGKGPAVGTTMTNGNIDTAATSDGALHINVSYKGGHKSIVVPATAPVVAFKPADRTILKVGGQAFIVAAVDGGKDIAKFVAVGQDGVKPPM